VTSKAALRPLTAAGARRAVFIDFEGTRGVPPTLLGVYEARNGSFRQTVLEQALRPAAGYKSPRITWQVDEDSPAGALERLKDLVETKGLRVFAWTKFEQRTIRRLLADFPRLRRFWTGRVEDAVPYAKAWKRRAHPDKVLPNKKGRGRHTLENYENLIGLRRHTMHGWGLTGKRIRAVRAALAKRGSMKRLTRIQKGYWTNLLIHNRDDCYGLAEVLKVATERPRRSSKK
jgi:hypothetical protein